MPSACAVCVNAFTVFVCPYSLVVPSPYVVSIVEWSVGAASVMLYPLKVVGLFVRLAKSFSPNPESVKLALFGIANNSVAFANLSQPYILLRYKSSL